MLQNGTRPSLLDKRDYSYHLTFGAAASEPLVLKEYNYDAGITMPDQNAEGFPYGCTGYTQSECKADMDKLPYRAGYTYLKTCLLENHGPDRGCDIRNSMKSGRVYGFQRMNEVTDEDAEKHRGGQTFNVDRAQGHDFFDSFRFSLRKEGKPISIGTPWFAEWGWAGFGNLVTKNPDGSYFITGGGVKTAIMPVPDTTGDRNTWSWHNYKICGEKTINSVPYLVAKSWQGTEFADKGWCYFSRETFNKGFDIYGTLGLIQAEAKPEDIQVIKLDLLQTALDFLNRILSLIGMQKTLHA